MKVSLETSTLKQHSYKENTLFSDTYSDIYYSKQGGFQEKTYIFIENSFLLEKLKKKFLTIFEFGFGAGLSFFSLLKKIKELQIESEITYFSIENYLLPREVIRNLIKEEESLEQELNLFLELYDPQSSSFIQNIKLNKNLTLKMIHSDVKEVFSKIQPKVDVWFLDGFSPSKNPEMWSDSLFDFIKKNSKFDASFATYATARVVKQGMLKSGFEIQKVKGYANKREMLNGFKKTENLLKDKPWFQYPKSNISKTEICILGTGLAATSLVHFLKDSSMYIRIIEETNSLFGSASANPFAIVCPKYVMDDEFSNEWFHESFAYFLEFVKKEKLTSAIYNPVGVIQKQDRVEFEKFKELVQYKTFEYTKENELFFPNAGYSKPKNLCEYYLKDFDKNKIFLNSKIASIQKEKENWRLYDEKGNCILETEVLVLANSLKISNLEAYKWLQKSRGQILQFPSRYFPTQKKEILIHEEGYFIPNVNGYHLLGATYHPENESSDIYESDTLELISKFESVHKVKLNLSLDECMYWAGVRTFTKDHLPVLGLVPNWESSTLFYSDLWKANPYKEYPFPEYKSNLYIHTAHGSKGVLNSFYSSKILSEILQGKIISKNVLEKLHPIRFLIRDKIRRQD
jgi:tRNA 5-methylaminomethyl-2-thiouridine biosynthesis bifunctional protein